MSIVLLVEQTMYGSALALIRPCFDVYVRGMWLMHAASDTEVDDFGRDEPPNTFGAMIKDLEIRGHLGADALSRIKAHWWKPLCSFTHGGYRQIGARLTADGLGYDYEKTEMEQALTWADGLAFMSLLGFTSVTDDRALAGEVLTYLRATYSTDAVEQQA